MHGAQHCTTSRTVQQGQSLFIGFLVIPNITGLLRPGIEAGPPTYQSDTLITTLPAPLVIKFKM